MVIWILTIMLSAEAAEVALPPVAPPTQSALPIDSNQPPIPCDQIAQKLTDYDKLARQADISVASFLGEVTSKLSQWHDLLAPLEGAPQTLPVGVFEPLQDGSDKISQVADVAWQNSALLAGEMDRIKTSLAACVLTPKSL